MTGVRILCGECYSDKANHSAALETVVMSSDDTHYIGSPATRTCDKCHVMVPYRDQTMTQQEIDNIPEVD